MIQSDRADILVVDDVPENLRVLTVMLTRRGYHVRGAINGQLALSATRKLPPDLILLDINMPGLSGYEVCERLKADEQTRDIPVIFISALDEPMDKVQAFKVGALDYITKPFHFEEVLARVETHLTLRDLRRRLESRLAALESELSLAHDIQRGLLPPSTPAWPGLEVVCYSRAARVVGGDFYSYYAFPPGAEPDAGRKFALAVGDVSGKGVSAALLMAASLSLFDSTVLQSLPPGVLLAQLDEALVPYTKPRGRNCALCCVEITLVGTTAGVLSVANAGCIPPYIRRPNGQVEFIRIGGLALGHGMEGTQESYLQIEAPLAAGDQVILTSDGVVEALNAAREMFGFERLEQVIADGPPESAQAMLNHLRTAVANFVQEAELYDDMTIVVAQVQPPSTYLSPGRLPEK